MAASLTDWLRNLRTRLPNQPDTIPDAELLGRYASNRDDQAFAVLVARHGPMVFGVCRRVCGTGPDAEDAFQAAFVVLAVKAAAVAANGRVGAYLHGVALHVARKARERSRGRSPASPDVLDQLPTRELPVDPDADHTRERIDEVLSGLPEKYRACVVLCELEGLSRKDAATRLGLAEGTLSSRLARARTLLADRLTRRGVTLGAGGLAAVLSARPLAASVPPNLAASAVRVANLVADGTSVPAGLAALTHGMTHSMLPRRLLLATALLGCGLLVGLGSGPAQSLAPTAPGVAVASDALLPQPAKAAPPAKAADNLIWVKYAKPGKLVALTPTGEQKKEIALKDGPLVFQINPDAGRLWFAGRDGQSTEPNEHGRWPEGKHTLHARAIDGKTTGEDLGVELTEYSILSPDGKTVGLVKLVQPGQSEPPQQVVFENALIDVATKKVTNLDVPGNHQLLAIAPDGKWVLTFEYTFPAAEKGTPPYRLHVVPLTGGKPRLLSGTLNAMYGTRISPDGTRVLTFAKDFKGKNEAPWDISAYVIDVATAKATRIAGHDKQLWSVGVWSADGKRIAYAWRARNDDGQPISANGVPPTRLVVCNADGSDAENAATILSSDDDFAPIAWW